MKALVTGGAGFVGSHLVELLADQGWEVVVLDDLSTGHASHLARSPATLVRGSVLDEPLVERLVDEVDVVFHLAATVGVHHVLDHPLDAMVVNARGTEHVLAACARADRRTLLVSTSEVNGRPTRIPMHEDDERVLGPTCVPRWSYASAKAFDEHLALGYAMAGSPFSVVRYFNVYGPRLDPRGYGSVVARFIAQALADEPLTLHGDGNQTRSFAYVSDVAFGTFLAGTRDEAIGTVVNLGSPRETTIRTLAELIRDAVGSRSPIEHVPYDVAYGPGFQDTPRRVPDVSRANDLLGWRPAVALEDGLERTIDWWLATFVPSSPARRRPPRPRSSVAVAPPTVAVVGLGYVGLPLAVAYAEAGFPTLGVDRDCERVAAVNAGHSHAEDVGDEALGRVVASGAFRATDDPARLVEADCVFVCVPTPFDQSRTPDLSHVREAAEMVAAHLRPSMLVVLQSTTYPGTTTEVVQPILERSGLVAGVDFDLAFSPERVDPGNQRWNVRNTPKLVGAVSESGARRTRTMLEAIMDHPGLVRTVSTPASAEMAKLLENTYRAVNIALVNELAMLAHAMGLDVWEVIDAAGTKPFGFQAFHPGVGPGGHCIPVDPCYLSWKARAFDFQTKFIELAADVNLHMVDFVHQRITHALNRRGRAVRGSRLLVLGLSFKPGVGDLRNSRALRLVEMLDDDGAVVVFSDPYVATARVNGRECKSTTLTDDVVAASDLVVILVDHPGVDLGPVLTADVAVFDAVNATAGLERPGLERL